MGGTTHRRTQSWSRSALAVAMRRLEPVVRGSDCAAWIKQDNGQFLAFSNSFARKLDLVPEDARRALDLDLFTRREVDRFRCHDAQVLEAGRSNVFIEPPDSISAGAWRATVKIPILDRAGQGVATLAFAHTLDLLEVLRGPARGRGRDTARTEPRTIAERLRDTLDRRFRDVFEVPSLARGLGCHPDHLSRCFRAGYGVTIAQYVAARRVAWVAWRLLETTEPIATLAADAGFCDQSHLTRTFQRVLGTTPARYRKSRASRGPVQIGARRGVEVAGLSAGSFAPG